jgi:hypothetical protein
VTGRDYTYRIDLQAPNIANNIKNVRRASGKTWTSQPLARDCQTTRYR